MLKRLDLKLQKFFFAWRLKDTMHNLNPKKAEPLTASQIRAYAEEVDEVLRILRRAEAEALKQEGQLEFGRRIHTLKSIFSKSGISHPCKHY